MKNAGLYYSFAIIGGIAGAVLGGLIYALVAYFTGWIFGIVATVSGTLAGFFAGVLGREAKSAKSIAVLGGVFGFIAVIMGYFIAYYLPLTIAPGFRVLPSDMMGFSDFFFLDFGPFEILFMALGIYGGYRAAESAHGNKPGASEDEIVKKPYSDYKNPIFWSIVIVVFALAIITVGMLGITDSPSASIVATIFALGLSMIIWRLIPKESLVKYQIKREEKDTTIVMVGAIIAVIAVMILMFTMPSRNQVTTPGAGDVLGGVNECMWVTGEPYMSLCNVTLDCKESVAENIAFAMEHNMTLDWNPRDIQCQQSYYVNLPRDLVGSYYVCKTDEDCHSRVGEMLSNPEIGAPIDFIWALRPLIRCNLGTCQTTAGVFDYYFSGE